MGGSTRNWRLRFVRGLLGALTIVLVAAPARAALGEQLPDGVFARVGDQQVSFDEYHGYMSQRLRQKYFHGRLVHEEMARAQKEIAQELIDHYLLAQEARRRGLVEEIPSPAQAGLHGAAASPWGEAIKKQLSEQVVVSDAEVEAYYKANPAKFTAPEQVRVSVILLRVAPYEPKEAWQAAYDEAVVLRGRIESGADSFAQLAVARSQHESAADGGDLGFVHKGRLAPEVEEVVERLELGKVSQPVPLLQGVALFRVDDKKSARLNPYGDVAERARLLLTSERADAAWRRLVDELRKTTPIAVAEGGWNGQ